MTPHQIRLRRLEFRNDYTEHKHVHQKPKGYLNPGQHVTPRVDGHDAAPAHREHVGCGKTETLLPARCDRTGTQNVLLKISLRVREARGRRYQGTNGYADYI